MKLCYIWINKYKNFDNFSLNLSSNKYFHYDSLKKTLNKRNNEKSLKWLFDEKISEIIAIVGANGTGKSNCLELICTILQGSIKKLDTQFIAIIEDDGKYLTYNNMDNGISVEFPHTLVEYTGIIRGINTIFFSNVYDNRKFEFSRDVINVTANNGYGYNRIREEFDLFSAQIDLITKHRTTLQETIGIELPRSINLDILLSSRVGSPNIDINRLIIKRIKDISKPENKLLCSLRFIAFIKIQNLYENIIGKFSLDIHDKEPTDRYLKRIINEIISSEISIPSHGEITNNTKEKIILKLKTIEEIENNIDRKRLAKCTCK